MLSVPSPSSRTARQRDVEVGVDQQANRRRARQSARLDVPSDLREDMVARGGEAGRVGHLAAGGDGKRRAGRQAEQVGEPPAHDLLGHGGRGRSDVGEPVLVPRRGHPVGGQGGRERAAEDEAPKKRGDWLAMKPGPAASTSSSSTARASWGRRQRTAEVVQST
jgi:hypothetical protein